MKLKLFSIPVLLLTFLILSGQSFAQSDSGGLDTGGGTGTGTDGGTTGGTTPPPPAPIVYTFKRNNGNGLGVCGGDAQIRVAFETIAQMASGEAPIPCIKELWYEDGKNPKVLVTNVVYPIHGEIYDKTQPYVSYCITGVPPAPGNSQGNINPAIKLTLVLAYYTSTVGGTANGVDITQ